jgi:hypothetical protein
MPHLLQSTPLEVRCARTSMASLTLQPSGPEAGVFTDSFFFGFTGITMWVDVFFFCRTEFAYKGAVTGTWLATVATNKTCEHGVTACLSESMATNCP